MDPVLIQILRNKISSLVEEMHYHFYRSGYSTIIRESRDFSCVILDRDGRLLDLFSSPHAKTITWDHLLRQTSDWSGTLWGKPDWADRPAADLGKDMARRYIKPERCATALNLWRWRRHSRGG